MLHAVGETVAIQIGELNIISTYWSPNECIDKSLDDLDAVIRMSPGAKWLIGGDLNVGLEPIVRFDFLNWRDQRKTEAAQPVIDSYGFTIWNNALSTCYHMGYPSINDYTLTLDIDVVGWCVVNTPTMDDHQFIEFQVPLDGVVIKAAMQRTTDLDRYNERVMEEVKLLPYEDEGNTRKNATEITNWLSRIIGETTVETKRRAGTSWWHPGLGRLKTNYVKKAMKARRCKNSDVKALLLEAVSYTHLTLPTIYSV